MTERHQRRRTVSVIGDGRLSPDDPRAHIARELGRLLIDHGFTLVTGGMGGVMEAACQGARESHAWTYGSVIALLPGWDPAAANEHADVLIPTGMDHLRNPLVAQSDAVIAVGGGAGTLTEMAFAWMYFRLVIGLRVRGWSGQLADQRIDDRVRYPEIEDDRVYGATTAEEAVFLVRDKLEQYTRRHHGIARRR